MELFNILFFCLWSITTKIDYDIIMEKSLCSSQQQYSLSIFMRIITFHSRKIIYKHLEKREYAKRQVDEKKVSYDKNSNFSVVFACDVYNEIPLNGI